MLLFYQIVEIAMAATNLSARHQGRTAESHSLADIDAVIARDPTLIFNIPEFVAEDDDLLLSDKGSSVPMPYSSEPNLHAGFIRWEAEEDHQIQKQAKEVKGSRLKQANREQVSAWLVNKRNAEGQKPSPSPSPSSKPSDGRTAGKSYRFFLIKIKLIVSAPRSSRAFRKGLRREDNKYPDTAGVRFTPLRTILRRV